MSPVDEIQKISAGSTTAASGSIDEAAYGGALPNLTTVLMLPAQALAAG